jgi:hypothetical protein
VQIIFKQILSLLSIFVSYAVHKDLGHPMAQFVEALRYKLAGSIPDGLT